MLFYPARTAELHGKPRPLPSRLCSKTIQKVAKMTVLQFKLARDPVHRRI